MVKFLPGLLVISELIFNSSIFLPIKDLDLVHPITSPSCGYFPRLKQPVIYSTSYGIIEIASFAHIVSLLHHYFSPCASQQDATNGTLGLGDTDIKLEGPTSPMPTGSSFRQAVRDVSKENASASAGWAAEQTH